MIKLIILLFFGYIYAGVQSSTLGVTLCTQIMDRGYKVIVNISGEIELTPILVKSIFTKNMATDNYDFIFKDSEGKMYFFSSKPVCIDGDTNDKAELIIKSGDKKIIKLFLQKNDDLDKLNNTLTLSGEITSRVYNLTNYITEFENEDMAYSEPTYIVKSKLHNEHEDSSVKDKEAGASITKPFEDSVTHTFDINKLNKLTYNIVIKGSYIIKSIRITPDKDLFTIDVITSVGIELHGSYTSIKFKKIASGYVIRFFSSLTHKVFQLKVDDFEIPSSVNDTVSVEGTVITVGYKDETTELQNQQQIEFKFLSLFLNQIDYHGKCTDILLKNLEISINLNALNQVTRQHVNLSTIKKLTITPLFEKDAQFHFRVLLYSDSEIPVDSSKLLLKCTDDINGINKLEILDKETQNPVIIVKNIPLLYTETAKKVLIESRILTLEGETELNKLKTSPDSQTLINKINKFLDLEEEIPLLAHEDSHNRIDKEKTNESIQNILLTHNVLMHTDTAQLSGIEAIFIPRLDTYNKDKSYLVLLKLYNDNILKYYKAKIKFNEMNDKSFTLFYGQKNLEMLELEYKYSFMMISSLSMIDEHRNIAEIFVSNDDQLPSTVSCNFDKTEYILIIYNNHNNDRKYDKILIHQPNEFDMYHRGVVYVLSHQTKKIHKHDLINLKVKCLEEDKLLTLKITGFYNSNFRKNFNITNVSELSHLFYIRRTDDTVVLFDGTLNEYRNR